MSWIGVDLDGCLSENKHSPGEIGAPVWPMVDRVKAWLAEGKEVRIFTARLYPHGRKISLDREAVVRSIQEWCVKYIGVPLEVTCEKDFQMYCLYDDRCRQVEANTGRVLTEGGWTFS